MDLALSSTAVLYQTGKLPDVQNYATLPGAPPTVKVTVAKEGEGTTSPVPGTYYLPKYRPTSWWQADASGNPVARPESSMTAADFASLTVKAAASGDGAFQCWRGGVTQISGSLPDALRTQLLQANGEDPNANKALPLVADWLLTAVFKDRPGMQGMDLTADVAALVAVANASRPGSRRPRLSSQVIRKAVCIVSHQLQMGLSLGQKR